jgi:hypothetical protein
VDPEAAELLGWQIAEGFEVDPERQHAART